METCFDYSKKVIEIESTDEILDIITEEAELNKEFFQRDRIPSISPVTSYSSSSKVC